MFDKDNKFGFINNSNNNNNNNIEGLDKVKTDVNNVKDDISNIKDNIGNEELTTNDKTVKGAVNELNAQYKEKANITDLAVERARIDNFTSLPEGSTTGDAELIDARIGANGVTYTNLGNAIRNQINAIVGYISASNTLTIDDSFTGKIISVEISAFKGQLIDIEVSCDASVLSNTYKLPVGFVTTDGQTINEVYKITPNKTYALKINYNIKTIKVWIGEKMANGDVTLVASIKNIYDYVHELENNYIALNNNCNNNLNNIEKICGQSFGKTSQQLSDSYEVITSKTVTDIASNISVEKISSFKKDEKLYIQVNGDCINSDSIIYGAITYPSGEQLKVFQLRPNSSVEFTPTDNATKIRIWISKDNLISTGTITLTIKNYINHTQSITTLNNYVNANKYKGLLFSILGDSYSSYKNWIPQDNVSWYAEEGNSTPENDVASVVDTWWYRLSKDTGMSLLINDSYSGSTVCNTGYDGADATPKSFTTRMVNTLGEKRVLQPKPNIIFIFGGTNDSWAGSPIGELKHSDWSVDDLKSFLPAFCYTLAYIKKYNPQARIINITNTDLKSEVSNAMSVACQYYNIENIVLSNISKTGGHPNKEGMEAIKNQIISIL